MSTTTTTSAALPLEDELPFLVTHWLSSVNVSDSDAQNRIHRAARELSEAFAAVGGFGHTAWVRFICLSLQ